MRNYEIVLIVHPDLDETAMTSLLDKVKGWITDSGGSIDKVDMWGKRRMTYIINKQHDAQYVLLNVQMAPAFTIEFERNIRFIETIMRFMVTVVE
ncbi:MAG TPA: 30S ribosomal protein S6 [Anaerolineaceae bacterium]|nr:30S ribosomal protein S6 [Anaerolineaceae bacterium]